jgi:predicted metal-binding membrane protein
MIEETSAPEGHPLIAQFARILDERQKRAREWLVNAALVVGIVACWIVIIAFGGILSLPLPL